MWIDIIMWTIFLIFAFALLAVIFALLSMPLAGLCIFLSEVLNAWVVRHPNSRFAELVKQNERRREKLMDKYSN